MNYWFGDLVPAHRSWIVGSTAVDHVITLEPPKDTDVLIEGVSNEFLMKVLPAPSSRTHFGGLKYLQPPTDIFGVGSLYEYFQGLPLTLFRVAVSLEDNHIRYGAGFKDSLNTLTLHLDGNPNNLVGVEREWVLRKIAALHPRGFKLSSELAAYWEKQQPRMRRDRISEMYLSGKAPEHQVLPDWMTEPLPCMLSAK